MNADSLSMPSIRLLTQPWVQSAIACGLLVAGTIGAFWPVTHAGFVSYDDPVYVTANAQVQGGLSWESVGWAFRNLDGGFWQPVTWLSLVLDYQLYGLWAGGYHWTNLLLHTTSVALLFVVLRRLTGAVWRSALVAALFALHPLQVESAAWVSERKGLLSTLFWMLALLTYARYVEGSKGQSGMSKVWYGLALVCCALGLMSKTMVVTLPCILLLMDWWPLRRMNWGTMGRLFLEKAPFFAMAAVAGFLTVRAESEIGALQAEAQMPAGYALASAIAGFAYYLGRIGWPSGLAVHYPCVAGVLWWQVAVAGLGMVGVSALLVWAARRRSYAAFGWVWYVVTLLPVIGLVQIGDHLRADRYTYLPVIGVFVAAVWGAHELTQRWRYHAIGLCFGALVVIAVYGALTRRQIACWKDSETLFRHATSVTEKSCVSETSLGVVLAEQGRMEEAIRQYEKALAINPGYPDAHSNLGVALEAEGRGEAAVTHYLMALESDPEHADAHNNLGQAMLQRGQVDEAIAHFRKALRRKPQFAGALNNLGVGLARKGQVDEAIRCFEAALRVRPRFAEAHYDLGTALLRNGQLAQAIVHFRKALSIRPGYPEAQHNLGNALLQSGKGDEGLACFQKALEIQPGFAEARNSLGWLMLHRGQAEEAIRHFQRALESRPGYAEAHNNLGLALLQRWRVVEAIGHFRQALQSRPEDGEAQHNLGIALLQSGEVDKAIGHLEKALELRPAFAEAHHNLGTALARKGRVALAMVQFEKAVEVRPSFAEAEYSLGNAYIQKGLAGEAVLHFERALAKRPKFAAAQNNLAWVLATWPEASVRNGSRAVELALEANRLSGSNSVAFMGTLGAAYAEAGRFGEAVEAAQGALRLAETQGNRELAAALKTQIALYEAGVAVRDGGQTNQATHPVQ